jgi:hypothetical protein
LAQNINFAAAVTQAKGIFIADNIDTGSTANQGLKIIGNLIAQSSLTNNRQWTNLNRPALFIVQDPSKYNNFYLDLLPYLSTASYEWRQEQ